MISASKDFKEKLKDGAGVVNYADVTLSNGTVLHLEPKDFMIGGCQIEDKTTDGKFGVGFAIGKTLTLRIANHDERFSRYDFYGSVINLYVALLLDNGTVEKIRKGVYYTIVPETPGDVIEISAVDGMFKLDRDYSSSKTSYPATLQRIISDACLDCGIPIGFRQFDNMSYTVKEKPDQGTYRQIISYACQIAGYNAHIDNNGYMQLVWYNTSLLDTYNYKGGDFHNYPHDTVVNGGNFTNYGSNTILSGGSFADAMPEHIFRIKSINVHTDDVQITGVRVSGQEEKTVLFGEEGYLIEVKENPFVNGKEQEVANYLGGRMVGMVFRPLSAEILNNPLYEPHDIVRASDARGNVYYTVLNSISYTIGSYTTVACEAEDPVRNGSEYVSAAAQAVVEARRNTEKQLTTYDKAVQNMNQLAVNAMGLFGKQELQENGSYISYESDKPITVDENGKCHFETGSHVWKKSDAGFFVSDDGGKTYTAGFDKNNNAVLNVLYAIGIVADWVKTGRFEITKGGKTMVLMDFDTGQVILRPDVFELSSGQTIDSIARDEANKKNKTFTTTPVPPYNVGDIWMGSSSSDIMTCIRARSSGSFASSDWEKRNKYVDKSTATSAAEEAANKAIKNQSQTDVLNALTNNGNDTGIYLQNGKLYISFTAIRGEELTLGGSSNAHGVLDILDASGGQIGHWSKDGFVVKNKYFAVTETGKLYSNNPILGNVLFMTTTVNQSSEITVSNMEARKNLVFQLTQGYSSSLGSYSTLCIGNDSSAIDDYLPIRRVEIRSKEFSYSQMEFEVYATTIIYGDFSLYNLQTVTNGSSAVFSGKKLGKESSSSERYKYIGREMNTADIEDLYNIQPMWAKYKPDYLSDDDERYNVEFPMFIAEDVEEYAPLAVDHNENGQAENWNYRIMIPYMFQMIKSQKEALNNLTGRIEKLESLLMKGSE